MFLSVDKSLCGVDNFVIWLLILLELWITMWITLLYVRVARTVLLFCLCDADSDASLCDGHI